MGLEQHLQAARNFLNEASNSLSLAETAVDALQKKADDLDPLSQQYDALVSRTSEKKAELAAFEKKLAEVQTAHAQFAKLITG